MNTDVQEGSCRSEPASSEPSLKALIASLQDIVETSCEHEQSLDFIRLINLLDLYRVYLQMVERASDSDASAADRHDPATGIPHAEQQTTMVSFEHFASSLELLRAAAASASQEYQSTIAVPAPLTPSANS